MFLDFGRELFPLCRVEEYGDELPIKQQGKKPLHRGWAKRHYGEGELLSYAAEGHNLGWRLGPSDMIIDVDPRNGGVEGLKVLLKDFKIKDLSNLAPTVNTGDSGWHYYFRVDAGAKLKKDINRYPGIDFLSKGNYIVIPGSWHYKAENLYTWDDLSPLLLPPPQVPEFLTTYLTAANNKQSCDTNGAGELTAPQLAEVLKQIPAREYNSNSSWLEMMLASHYATAGEGGDVFTAWSLTDADYAGDEDLIRDRWHSVRNDDNNLITTATLYKHLKAHGGHVPRGSAVDDFEGFLESKEVIDKIKNAPVEVTDHIGDAIAKLDETSNSRDISAVLNQCLDLDPVHEAIVVRDLSQRVKLSKRALGAQLQDIKKLKTKDTKDKTRSLEDADIRDLVQQVTAVLLKEKYNGGEYLRFLEGNEFWFYDGRKWNKYFNGLIKRDIYEAILTMRTELPHLEFDAARIMSPVEKILIAKAASETTLFQLAKGRPPIINLLSGELWLDDVTGSFKKRKHKASSNLTYCLDIELDENAKCPLFDKTLSEIFATEKEKKEIIRHLWEIIGYVIQPKKDIASWFLFLGSGANGKSLIFGILSALLGDAALEQDIQDFNSSNRFAKTALIGKLAVLDDDVSAKTILPDGFLKKVSENKIIASEVKMGPVIRFQSTAAVLLSANSMPASKDISHGLFRRAMVIPFRRTFKRSEMDFSRGGNIIKDELPGVLMQALRSYKKLRARGDFKIPRTCKNVQKTWRDESNALIGFISDSFDTKKEETVSGNKVWALYNLWAADNGIASRYVLSKRMLYKGVEEMGFFKFRGAKGQLFFKGIKYTEKETKCLE